MYNSDETGMTTLEKAWNTLYYHIGLDELECADNMRVANMSNQAETDAYDDAIDQGCCGSFDITVKIDNITFMIGCNYGH
jgi:hypothetical protein